MGVSASQSPSTRRTTPSWPCSIPNSLVSSSIFFVTKRRKPNKGQQQNSSQTTNPQKKRFTNTRAIRSQKSNHKKLRCFSSIPRTPTLLRWAVVPPAPEPPLLAFKPRLLATARLPLPLLVLLGYRTYSRFWSTVSDGFPSVATPIILAGTPAATT